MEYITAKEASEKWGVTERMVRVYCSQGRISDAYSEFDTWYIPADAEKPARKPKEVKPTPLLLQKIIKQRDGKQYRGFYEYLQINMVYSSGRMASNRLTRNQIEVLYKKDRIFTTSEDIKVNDIVEARNHFLCVDTILTNAMKPLTQTFINQLRRSFSVTAASIVATLLRRLDIARHPHRRSSAKPHLPPRSAQQWRI